MPKVAKRSDEPERGRSVIDDELLDLQAEFDVLAVKAMEAGYSTAIIISGFDPISNQAHTIRGYRGNLYAIIGSTRAAVREWEEDL